jgi:transcriptional regulator with XRE-family HTH domain
MHPDDLERLCIELFPHSNLKGWGWQAHLARGTGISPSSLQRYLRGEYPIPQYVALIIELLIRLKRDGKSLPEVFYAEENEPKEGP